jgi:hypothetical protein
MANRLGRMRRLCRAEDGFPSRLALRRAQGDAPHPGLDSLLVPIHNTAAVLHNPWIELRRSESDTTMIFEHIDKLKQRYTDKYVVVDESLPELSRFRGLTGTVKTVNYSGKALVEFDGYANIGWYDIDPSYLKLIDAPLPPKPKEAAPAKKPAGEPASAGGKPAAKAKPAAPAAAGAKPSTADILAKLRGGAAAKTQATGETAAAATPAKPAAAKPAAAPAGKVDRSKMSVADMLAAARAGKAAGEAPAAAPPQAAPEPVEEQAVEETQVSEPASAGGEPAKTPPTTSGPIDKSTMSIDQMCAWCREHDTK